MINKRDTYYLVLYTLIFSWAIFGIVNQSKAEGGLSLSQTRVVFNSNAKNTKITINNHSDRVYLINSRVLITPNGQEKSIKAMPFMATPPLFRLEEESQNTILISRNDISLLPTDRESLFYLSFLAIPSVKKNTAPNAEDMTTTQLSLGLRMLIKLFYRPHDLAIPASAAPKKLTFSQKEHQLQVQNPTPYYQTLAQLKINGQPVNVREQGAMIAPFSSHSYQIKEIANEIHWSVINDYGGLSDTFHWIR